MRVDSLQLANVRPIASAEFVFQPGFNLIVGVNGVGKTTVLHVLTHVLSLAARAQGHPANTKALLSEDDVRYGSSGLSIRATLRELDTELTIIDAIHRSEGLIGHPGEIAPNWDKLPEHIAQQRGKLRQAMREAQDTPSDAELPLFGPNRATFRQAQDVANSSLAILFGTDRAFSISRKVPKGKVAGGTKSAFSDALSSRTLNPQLFSEWMRALAAQSAELPRMQKTIDSLRDAVEAFVPGYKNLRPTTTGTPSLLVDVADPQTVSVEELSSYDRHRLAAAIDYAESQMSNWSIDDKKSPEAVTEDRDAAIRRETELALQRFMSGYTGLDRSAPIQDAWTLTRLPGTFNVSALSDGERSLISLVLDISRRMIAAYPKCNEPTTKGEAIVLIDEIELHLHPRWQRQVVRNLTRTFPNCQFIATTHSPQVIGEVPNENIQIMDDGEVYSPEHSYGMPSSRVLEEIMEARSRTKAVDERLKKASVATANEDYATAKKLLAELVEDLGDNDPDVIRIRSLIGFMEGEE